MKILTRTAVLSGLVFAHLTANAQVIAWGSNAYGESTLPMDLEGGVIAIAAGCFNSLALKANGTVVGWGGTTDWGFNGADSPIPPTGLTDVKAIAAGYFHYLALKTDGTVVGWGFNSDGQADPPTGLTGVKAVAVGEFHSLALKTDGTVVGWGRYINGETTPPSGLAGVIAIAAGDSYSVALKNNGTIVCWGGSGMSAGPVSAPSGLSNVRAISANLAHVLVLKFDGTVMSFDPFVNTLALPPTPPPAGLADVTAIAAGAHHDIALKKDGTVVTWGDVDFYGESDPPPGGALLGIRQIAAGSYHNLATTFVCGGGPIASVTWTYTDEGFIDGGQNGAFRQYDDPATIDSSPWVPSNEGLTLRLNFEDDGNCANHNQNVQRATARASVQAGLCVPFRMFIDWSGLGEREDSGFEEMVLFVDGVEVGRATSPGGSLDCAGGVGPVISDPPAPQFVDLTPGAPHELLIEATTLDEKWHVGAYYQFTLRFDTAPGLAAKQNPNPALPTAPSKSISNLTVVCTSGNDFTLSWNFPSNETKYAGGTASGDTNTHIGIFAINKYGTNNDLFGVHSNVSWLSGDPWLGTGNWSNSPGDNHWVQLPYGYNWCSPETTQRTVSWGGTNGTLAWDSLTFNVIIVNDRLATHTNTGIASSLAFGPPNLVTVYRTNLPPVPTHALTNLALDAEGLLTWTFPSGATNYASTNNPATLIEILTSFDQGTNWGTAAVLEGSATQLEFTNSLVSYISWGGQNTWYKARICNQQTGADNVTAYSFGPYSAIVTNACPASQSSATITSITQPNGMYYGDYTIAWDNPNHLVSGIEIWRYTASITNEWIPVTTIFKEHAEDETPSSYTEYNVFAYWWDITAVHYQVRLFNAYGMGPFSNVLPGFD